MADVPLRISGLTLTATAADRAAYMPQDASGYVSTKKITVGNFIDSLVFAGNMIYVDAVNGDDDTGEVGQPTLPFLTLAAAQTAASSGDLIDVYPGSYTLTAALGKNGVNWNLRAGVTITRTNTAINPANLSVFYDGGTAMTFRVSGRGDLVLSGQNAADAGGAGCVHVSHASSNITVECRSILTDCAGSGDSTGPAYCVYQTAGTCVVKADTIEIDSDGASYGIWWVNGALNVTALSIIGNDSGGAIGGELVTTATGEAYIVAQSIIGSSYPVSLASTDTEAKMWVTANEIASSSTGRGAVYVYSGKLYVTAQKLSKGTQAIPDVNGVVGGNGGQLWLVGCGKLTSTYGYGIACQGATIRGDVLQIEDLGNMTNAIKMEAGTLELRGAQATMTVGNGVNHSAGTARLMGCRFDTSASAGKNPVTVSGSGLILDHCTLVANAAADSITAGSAKTVKNYYSVANTAKNANITINDGSAIPLTVYSGVV